MLVESAHAWELIVVTNRSQAIVTIGTAGANKLALPANIVHTVFTFFGLELYPED